MGCTAAVGDGARCPRASPATPICQDPISSGARPPCPQITWAATCEGDAAVNGHEKPIAFPLGSPGGGTFPGQTLLAASHCSLAQPGTVETDGAEPSLGRAVCRPRVPACASVCGRQQHAGGCGGARRVHVALPVRAWEVGRGAEGGGCHATCAGSPLRRGRMRFSGSCLIPRAPAARECVAKAMGTILLILLSIVLLPALRCPGCERRRRRQPVWDEGCLQGGEDAPHDPPGQSQQGWGCAGCRDADGDGESGCWQS